jgi:hypothetical protein
MFLSIVNKYTTFQPKADAPLAQQNHFLQYSRNMKRVNTNKRLFVEAGWDFLKNSYFFSSVSPAAPFSIFESKSFKSLKPTTAITTATPKNRSAEIP